MKASDIIAEMQERIKIYGDWEVVFREAGGDSDFDVLSVYGDTEAERIVVSNFLDLSEMP